MVRTTRLPIQATMFRDTRLRVHSHSPYEIQSQLRLGAQRRHNGSQRHRVGTAKLLDVPVFIRYDRPALLDLWCIHSLRLAVGEEDESRHCGDAVLARHRIDVVDIDLGKGQLALDRVLVGELGEDRGNGAAGRTPVGIEVDDDVGVAVEDSVELGSGGDFVDLA